MFLYTVREHGSSVNQGSLHFFFIVNLIRSSTMKKSHMYHALNKLNSNNSNVVRFMAIFALSYGLFWTLYAAIGTERHSKTIQNHLNDFLFGMIIFSTIFTLGNYKTCNLKDFRYLLAGSMVTLYIWTFISKIKFFQFDLSNMSSGQISCIVIVLASIVALAAPLLKVHFINPSTKFLSVSTLLITLLTLTFTSDRLKTHHYQIFGLLALLSNIETRKLHKYSKFVSGLCLGSVAHGISAYHATGISTNSNDTLIY